MTEFKHWHACFPMIMASAAEDTTWPANIHVTAQGVMEDYSNQWHILKQLKSSVAVPEFVASAAENAVGTNGLQESRATLPNKTDMLISLHDAGRRQETANEWFVLPESTSSGHTSDAESESVLDVADLKPADGKHQEKDMNTEADVYQEQWHELDELKASVKALHWSQHSSNYSLPAGKAQGIYKDFTEPHKRSPSGSIRSTSEISSRFQTMPGELELISQHASQELNSSSDISLESELLGFASLPNRPATIGNYGVNDAAPYTIAKNGTLPVKSQDSSGGSIADDNPTADDSLSKAPLPARERLQPDGRDGPDVLVLPPVTCYALNGSIQSMTMTQSASSSGLGSTLNYSGPANNLPIGHVQTANTAHGVLLPFLPDRVGSQHIQAFPIDVNQHALPTHTDTDTLSEQSLDTACGHLEGGVPQHGLDMHSWSTAGPATQYSSPTAMVLHEKVSPASQVHYHVSSEGVFQRPADQVNANNSEHSLTDAQSSGSIHDSENVFSPAVDNTGQVDNEIHMRIQDITARYIGNGSRMPNSSSAESDEQSIASESNMIGNMIVHSSSCDSETGYKELPAFTVAPSGISRNSSSADMEAPDHVHRKAYQPSRTISPASMNISGSTSASSHSADAPKAVVNKIRAVMDSDDDFQSPVSKLLGPQFRVTQEYLGKLKRERSNSASIKLSETDSHQEISSYQLPTFSERNTVVPPYSSKFKGVTSSSIGDIDLDSQRKVIKQAWRDEREDARQDSTGRYAKLTEDNGHLTESKRNDVERPTLPDSNHLRNSQSSSGKESPWEEDNSQRSTSTLSSVHTVSSLLRVSNDRKNSVCLPTSKAQTDSMLEVSPSVTPLQDGATTDQHDLHSKPSSLSTFETPLTSFVPKPTKKQASGSHSYSSSSSTLVSLHDEAEDTDDLLSYEAALGGDLKYFRQLRKGKPNTTSASHPTDERLLTSSVDSNKVFVPAKMNGDISSIMGSADRAPRQSAAESTEQKSDDMTRHYHLSLGAGVISPVTESETSKYAGSEDRSHRLETKSNRGADGLLIENKEDEGQTAGEEYNTSGIMTPTIESSSSSIYLPNIQEIHQLTQPPNDDQSLTTNIKYGLYDIRKSSGPGSTNRRRRAMGLSPMSHRVPREADSTVYVSAESTQGSIPEEGASDSSTSIQEAIHQQSSSTKYSPTLSSFDKAKPSTLSANYSSPREVIDADKHSDTRQNLYTNDRISPKSRNVSQNSSQRSVENYGSLRKNTQYAKGKHDQIKMTRSSSGYGHKGTKTLVDDYVGGRKSVQSEGKPSSGRRRLMKRERVFTERTSSDDSDQQKEFDNKKNQDLNKMWERFQKSLRSSPTYSKKDSVSSHLGRLSSLLSKPLCTTTTTTTTTASSETEHEPELSKTSKPRSSSYSSSNMSSDLTQLNEGFTAFMRNPSFSQQIKLRKLLETINLADVPSFSCLGKHNDVTTTTSTESDTSTSETVGSVERDRVSVGSVERDRVSAGSVEHDRVPVESVERDRTPVVSSRGHRGSRKVSRTPVLEPSSHSRVRPRELTYAKVKCICSGQAWADKPQHSRPVQAARMEEKSEPTHTRDVAVNFPTPKHRVNKKKTKQNRNANPVDVGVQTNLESDCRLHDDYTHANDVDNAVQDHARQYSPEKQRELKKERLIASQNSPPHKPYFQDFRHRRSRTSDIHDCFDVTLPTHVANGKPRGQHSKERNTANQNPPVAKAKHEQSRNDSGQVWFYPVSNKHYSRSNEPESTIRPVDLKYDDQTVKMFSPPVAAAASMQKLTLQEAFIFAKSDFVSRSRARLSRMDHNKVVRERGESVAEGEQRVSKMEIPSKPSITKKPPVRKSAHAENLHHPRPRRLTKKEIKDLNKKLYNNLPEVKAQKDESRRIAFYKTNRLKAQLYDKRVRERLKTA